MEYSFEELRALSRGWKQKDWRPVEEPSPLRVTTGNATKSKTRVAKSHDPEDIESLTQAFQQKADLNPCTDGSVGDVSTQSMVGMPAPDSQIVSQPAKKERKIKIREVKQQTQTVKARLDSPTGKKLKRKNNSTAEPTMTFHSKSATNDIYDMFNQPLRKPAAEGDDTQSGDETGFTEDDGYSTAGESTGTGTGRVSAPSSEFGDETLASIRRGGHSQVASQSESVSPWSDFSTSKDVPRHISARTAGDRDEFSSAKPHPKHQHKDLSGDLTENIASSSQNPTQTSGLGNGFDTQAIAAIAGGDFEEMDTRAIAMLAGDHDVDEGAVDAGATEETGVEEEVTAASTEVATATTRQDDFIIHSDEPLTTPTDDGFPEQIEIQHQPRYVPLPPVDYEPTLARPYRDPKMMAQNKLPFMTPIAERTESSLAPSTVFNAPEYFDTKTPSKSKYDSLSKLSVENLLLSSPQPQEQSTPTSASSAKRKYGDTGASEDEVATSSPQKKSAVGKLDLGSMSPPALKADSDLFRTPAPKSTTPGRSPLTKIHKGPIIEDLQCNPCDEAVRQQILTTVYPPVSIQPGYHNHSDITSEQYDILKSFAQKEAKAKAKASPRKSQVTRP